MYTGEYHSSEKRIRSRGSILVEAGNRQVAEQLTLMGQLLEILDGNVFKVRAYLRAADLIERMGTPVAGMSEEELASIPGIGTALARKIREVIETGTFHELEDTRKEVPGSLIELLQLEGVGPKTVKVLWKKLSVKSVDDLEREARAHRIRAIKGFGEKKEQGFLKAITYYREQSGRMTLLEAGNVAGKVIPVLKEGSFEVAGSYRRGKSTIGDIDIVSMEPPSLLNPRLRGVAEEVIDEGDRRTSIRVLGKRVDVRFTSPARFGSMLLYLTGSKAFNIKLREIAMGRGLKLNEYGIEDRTASRMHEFSREEDIFNFLNMDYVVPELREDWGEVEAAMNHTLPQLVTMGQVKGDLHVHSNWSDGKLSLEDLARAGERQGYQYIVCSDHSSTLGIAHGLDEQAFRKQQHEIEMVNRQGACHIFHGAEVDILADGSLGLSGTILGDLDVVIGSVHSAFGQDTDVMTRRIIAAMESGHVHIIGHPTGRILGRRPPYEIDMARVIDSAAATGTALECNASPYRLDLDDAHIREAVLRGVKIGVGTDMHDPVELDFMKFGIITCRRGWAGPGAVLNTFSLPEILEWAG
jgi:DNA polymerase (family 10)